MDHLARPRSMIRSSHSRSTKFSGSDEQWIKKAGMVGRSSSLAKACQRILSVREGRENVFISGETGTGKEYMVRALAGDRANADIPTIDCGRYGNDFEFFYWEIFGSSVKTPVRGFRPWPGILAGHRDAPLLYFQGLNFFAGPARETIADFFERRRYRPFGSTESLPVFSRFVATQSGIEPHPAAAKSLERLQRSMNPVWIELPPLRARPEDIEPLTEHFCASFRKTRGMEKVFSMSALALLLSYQWPGNVQELENVVYQACAMSFDRVEIHDQEVAEIIGMKTLLRRR
jgi:DNA-binding NtrC family response regulator